MLLFYVLEKSQHGEASCQKLKNKRCSIRVTELLRYKIRCAPAGDRFPVAVRNPANQALAAHATTTHPHHFRIGGGLVVRGRSALQRNDSDEDQPGRVKQAPLPHPAPTRPRHVGPLLLRRPQAFFLNVMS